MSEALPLDRTTPKRTAGIYGRLYRYPRVGARCRGLSMDVFLSR